MHVNQNQASALCAILFNEYNLDYAITATQKAILKAFDMTADNVHKQARAISSDLARVAFEVIESNVENQEKSAEGK